MIEQKMTWDSRFQTVTLQDVAMMAEMRRAAIARGLYLTEVKRQADLGAMLNTLGWPTFTGANDFLRNRNKNGTCRK